MGFLFGGPKTNAKAPAKVTGLRVQTSASGLAIPVVYGAMRIAGNLIWYGDFVAIPHNTGQGGGGKGGGGGTGGKGGGGGGVSYTYQAAVAIGLCEGPITVVKSAWIGKQAGEQAGFVEFDGTYSQTAWGYLSTNHPGQDLAYRGIAYRPYPAFDLGASQQLPNLNYEIQGATAGAPPPDCDPSFVVSDMLTNPNYGAGFPAQYLGDLSTFRAYCIASGLVISPAFTEQKAVGEWLKDLAEHLNSAFVWSSGALTLVPYGDQAITANGFTYSPPSAPLYSLGDDDFQRYSRTSSVGTVAPEQGTSVDPVQMRRMRPADQINALKVEYLDRANAYNPQVAEAKDDAAINLYGLRHGDIKQAHWFASAPAARLSVQLMLQRQAVRNQYVFYLGPKYMLLDPMDIIAITDPGLGLANQWVRITEIEEEASSGAGSTAAGAATGGALPSAGYALKVTCEEYLAGTGAAPIYGQQANSGYAANYNADPGNVNVPIIFEPPDQLVQDPEVWIAVSGAPASSGGNWGGADVWVSTDGSSYQFLARVLGPARMGTLTATLPAGGDPDVSDTLAVDLTESGGNLLNASQLDADLNHTLCYVDGELISYQTAFLTGTYRYNLTYLRRGAYGTPIGSHAAGAPFARLDSALLRYPYPVNLIGKPIYLKFLSFNVFGGGEQQIASLNPYTYYIQGTILTSPLPNVGGLTPVFQGQIEQLYWQQVADFRSPIDYEIRIGPSWAAANVLGRASHTVFPTQGDGTYWVAAHYRSPTGVDVYSATPAGITITGSVLTANIVATVDEAALNWNGTFAPMVARNIILNYIQLVGAGNVLTDTNLLAEADVLNLGGIWTGTGQNNYTFNAAQDVNVGRVENCIVSLTYTAYGLSIYDNFLTIGNLLSVADLLGAALAQKITITPKIRVAGANHLFGSAQTFYPGVYQGQYFRGLISLFTSDPTVIPVVTDVVLTVTVPAITESGTNVAIAAAGASITFPNPFNAGPGGAAAPNIQVAIIGASQGDQVIITNKSLAGFTVQVTNGGAGMARTIDWIAQGY